MLQQSEKDFTIEQVVGTGTFGMVHLATDNRTKEKVAIKKVYQDRRYKNREHLIIQELNHPCVVMLRHSFFTPGENPQDVYLNLVMEYVPETLSKMIRQIRKQKQTIPSIQLKLYSYQMLRALLYLQAIGICHRDIKPQNILINLETNVLKICDFGSAKRLVVGEPNIAYICSRYYRAPELIFGATDYTTQIDMWSIGCVIVEMIILEPIFPGESAQDQLLQIIKILGTPTPDIIKQMNPAKAEVKLPMIKGNPWSKVLAKYKPDQLFLDLISQMLTYSPKARIQPIDALLHPYFDDLRKEEFTKSNIKFPNLFDFNKQELSIRPELNSKLIPQWYQKLNT
ncbi:unnamed protein product [Paramecium primaurelia]|uniref:Protein kinase domain-containing protein n=2 Tax=Paramecium primaurelia TaxID=5886 RepID=A0A8S1PGU8_PARPR|nr:unnamed protein product [Paramecium primaurelia]